jgi:tetratricopeptide (TPR) repeat protein
MRRGPLAVGALVLMLLAPRVAAAARSVDAEVKRLANVSHEQYQKGDFKGAAETLLKAYELKPVQALLFNIARSYEKAGDDVKALEYYRRYRDSSPDDADLVGQASRAIDRLEAGQREKEKAAQAEAAKKAAEDQAEKDRLAAERTRLEQAEKDRQAKDAAAAAAAAQPPPQPRSRALPYTLIGVGGAGLLAGGALGLTARSLANDEKASTDPVAKPDLRSQAKTRALVADVAYGVGAAALVAGIVIIATEPKAAPVEGTTAVTAASLLPQPVIFDHGAGLCWGGAL